MRNMRLLFALPLFLAAGCEPHGGGNTAAPAASESPAVPPVSPADAAAGMRGPELASSPSAQEAKLVVQLYYTLIAQRRYAAARKLWGQGGAESGGDVAAFAKGFERYAAYASEVGEPTDIKSSDGKQYISVHVTVTAQRKGSTQISTIDGPILLRRASDPTEPDADKRDWRIWGADVRAHR